MDGQKNLFLVSSYIPPYFLDHATQPCSSSPFCYFLPYSPISYGWQPLFWQVPYFIAIPSSGLDTVLLVVLEHPSIFLAAVICAVSSCFTNFAFPSYTSPAYSSFGTITFIGTHILILVQGGGLRCDKATNVAHLQHSRRGSLSVAPPPSTFAKRGVSQPASCPAGILRGGLLGMN